MAPSRILYAAQSLVIDAFNALGVQSASCETTIPIEDISVLSKLGSAGRFQKEVATCKSEIKIYATAGLGDIISGLMVNADAGAISTIEVSPNGFSMSGILSSFSLDASKGDFVTASLSFEGVGEARHLTGLDTSLSSEANAGLAITPMTSTEVKVAGSCPSSLKYSLDIPNETVTCLGSVITGSQSVVAAGNQMFSKPPFKSSLNLEGLNVDLNTAVITFTVGPSATPSSCIEVVIADGSIASKSFNQSAGDVGATYSNVVEGTDARINSAP